MLSYLSQNAQRKLFDLGPITSSDHYSKLQFFVVLFHTKQFNAYGLLLMGKILQLLLRIRGKNEVKIKTILLLQKQSTPSISYSMHRNMLVRVLKGSHRLHFLFPKYI